MCSLNRDLHYLEHNREGEKGFQLFCSPLSSSFIRAISILSIFNIVIIIMRLINILIITLEKGTREFVLDRIAQVF